MSYELTVDPKIEMLGILEYLAVPDIPNYFSSNPPHPLEQEYHAKVVSYFAPFMEHPALLELKKMKELGFKSDQAVRLLLYHSQIPYLFSQPVIQNQKHLEWIQTLRLWIDETKYPSFYEKNTPFYEKIMHAVELAIDQIPIFDVIELFFGEKRESYHMMASSIKTGTYNVFLPNRGIAAVIGSPILSSRSIYERIIHELSYSFIRPAVDLHWSRFQIVQGAGVISNHREPIYEMIVKAVQSVLVVGSVKETALLSDITDFITTEYQRNRSTYPTFASFIPRLVSVMKGI